MRKLWIVCALLIFSLMTPDVIVDTYGVDRPQLLNSTSPSGDLQRVYGINLAPNIYGEVSQTNYLNYVKDLTSVGPRYIMTYGEILGSANEAARNWIVDKLTTLSDNRIEVSLVGDYKNVVGLLPGYLPDEDLPVFVVSAHYDTVENCPGANDDGSGIAAVLELARVMSKYEWPLDIYFIAFNGDHARYDLQGSGAVANKFANEGIEILALYNVDTILCISRYAASDERVLLAYNQGSDSIYHLTRYWAELAKSMSNIYGLDSVGVRSSNQFTYWESSDHYVFIERGYSSSLCVFESGNMYDTAYRTNRDVWDRSDYRYYIGAETTGFIGASIAFTMGRAFGQKTLIVDTSIINPSVTSEYRFPISTSTTINITSRWYGGGANFTLYDPSGNILNSTLQTDGHPWTPTQLFSSPVTLKGLYKLVILNIQAESIGADVYIEFDADLNNNGVHDSQEYWLSPSLFGLDSDNDSINDAMEIIYGTDSENADSDGDTLPDAWEIERGLNPTDSSDANEDPDGDSLTNAQEYYYGTDVFDSDSDSDGMSDDWELAHGLNPLLNDADENPDNDRYTNIQEYARNSDPFEPEVEPIPITWIAVPSAAVILLGIGVYILRRERTHYSE